MVQKLRLLVCLVVAATMAHGAHGATPEDAKAMAEKAALYLSENGEDKAFAAINDPVGPFRRGDLYVFVHDTTGMVRPWRQPGADRQEHGQPDGCRRQGLRQGDNRGQGYRLDRLQVAEPRDQ